MLAAVEEAVRKEEPGKGTGSLNATSTMRSWGLSPEASAGESGSTARMNWPGLDLSLCRLVRPLGPFFTWRRAELKLLPVGRKEGPVPHRPGRRFSPALCLNPSLRPREAPRPPAARENAGRGPCPAATCLGAPGHRAAPEYAPPFPFRQVRGGGRLAQDSAFLTFLRLIMLFFWQHREACEI